MPKLKIPRKSTTVDMTAMCDVAFLLLSFFILATKQKPDEALSVNIPSSISAKAAPEKAFIVTLTKDGRAFLTLGEGTKVSEVIDNIDLNKGLGLTPAEKTKLGKIASKEAIGVPLNKLKGLVNMGDKPNISHLPGIPLSMDSTGNELSDWLRAITNVYAGGDQKELEQMILIKGDNDALYPKFKAIKEALKKNQLFKFRIITNGQAVPVGSELYMNTAGTGKPKD